jgi:hypothetical protein
MGRHLIFCARHTDFHWIRLVIGKPPFSFTDLVGDSRDLRRSRDHAYAGFGKTNRCRSSPERSTAHECKSEQLLRLSGRNRLVWSAALAALILVPFMVCEGMRALRGQSYGCTASSRLLDMDCCSPAGTGPPPGRLSVGRPTSFDINEGIQTEFFVKLTRNLNNRQNIMIIHYC